MFHVERPCVTSFFEELCLTILYGQPYYPLWVKHMKKTLAISDDLIARSKIIQSRYSITFKALVEEGLRLAIEKRSTPNNYQFTPVFGGQGWLTEDAQRAGGLGAVLTEVNER